MWKRFLVLLAGAGLGWGQNCRGPVCVEMGAPSLWTLDQAHYLLERNRFVNRTLRVKALGELDPNGINRSRLDLARQYLGVSVEYNQKQALDNRNVLRTREEQVTRKRASTERIEVLRSARDQAARERVAAQYELDVLKASGAAATTIGKQEAEVARLTGEVNILNQQIADAAVADPGEGTTTATSAAAPPAAGDRLLPDAERVKLLAPLLNKEAALASSVQLENYISQQYELVARQLTLLRDEAGPGRKVVFLELPQSIYTADKKGNDYVVRTRWRISRVVTKDQKRDAEGDLSGEPLQQEKSVSSSYWDMRMALDSKFSRIVADEKGLRAEAADASSVRAVELIPSRSYLTVNQYHENRNTKNILGVVKTLVGWGAQVEYQKQKEQYELFMSQEVHASAMGKGSNEFGWVFGPEPGRKRISPGERSTYAVIWVPAAARGLEIERFACSFKKDATDADRRCAAEGNLEKVVVEIPASDEGFFVEKVSYQPVPSGGTATVHVQGTDFSPQMSVLVDGQPLFRSLAVGDPALAREFALATAPAPVDGVKFHGEYEVINSEHILLKISSAKDAPARTPEITLVSQNRSLTLNWVPLTVNGRHKMVLTRQERNGERERAVAPLMFQPPPLRLLGFQYQGRAGGKIEALLLGGPFDREDEIRVGEGLEKTKPESRTRRIIKFPRPKSANWNVFVTSFGDAVVTESLLLPDPLAPDPKTVNPVSVEALQYDRSGKATKLVLTIEGSGFWPGKKPTVKGTDDCGGMQYTAEKANVAETSYLPDGGGIRIVVSDPPACLQVDFKKADGDRDHPWPLSQIKRPDRPSKPEPKPKETPAN